MKQINAPFTKAQIDHINSFQNEPVHPFTCGNDGSALIAQEDGMHCPNCDWHQTWAHEPMADGSALNDMAAMMRAFKGSE